MPSAADEGRSQNYSGWEATARTSGGGRPKGDRRGLFWPRRVGLPPEGGTGGGMSNPAGGDHSPRHEGRP